MSGRSDEWKSRCNFPPTGGKVAPPAFYDGLGVPDEWAFPMNGRSDEWKGRNNLPPSCGKLHLPHFTDERAFPFNGNAH